MRTVLFALLVATAMVGAEAQAQVIISCEAARANCLNTAQSVVSADEQKRGCQTAYDNAVASPTHIFQTRIRRYECRPTNNGSAKASGRTNRSVHP
jgi:hypothetical protein